MAGKKTSEISSFMKSMVYSGAFISKTKKGCESYHMLNKFAGEDRRQSRFDHLRQI